MTLDASSYYSFLLSYREDLLNIDGADSHDDSDGASSNDDNEGGSDADLGAEEDELEDPEDTGEFNKPKEGEALIGKRLIMYRRGGNRR